MVSWGVTAIIPASSTRFCHSLWCDFSGLTTLSVVQIEPMSCQAVNCGHFCLQRSTSFNSSPSKCLFLPVLLVLVPIFTRCAYAQGRVKCLSPSIYIIYVCVCVCHQKTRLFCVLPLENRHEIALYRSASQFIFSERCLKGRTSLLSSAMAMGF